MLGKQFPLLRNKSPYASGKMWKCSLQHPGIHYGKDSRACTWICEQGSDRQCESVHMSVWGRGRERVLPSVAGDWLDGSLPTPSYSTTPEEECICVVASKKLWNCVGCVSGDQVGNDKYSIKQQPLRPQVPRS